MPEPGLDAEHHWFNQWRLTVEGEAQIYGQISDELYLRAADIELVTEIAISKQCEMRCVTILRSGGEP